MKTTTAIAMPSREAVAMAAKVIAGKLTRDQAIEALTGIYTRSARVMASTLLRRRSA